MTKESTNVQPGDELAVEMFLTAADGSVLVLRGSLTVEEHEESGEEDETTQETENPEGTEGVTG